MKVSVIIPFYNRNELLRGSIASVLAQTRPAHEIIVVDDCSPEDISWLAQEFPAVRVMRLPRNLRASGARYHGAVAATGTHVATLDGDDFWYPEKLERQVAFANKINDPRGIYCHQQWVEEGGGGTIRPNDGPRPGEPASEYLYVRGGFIQSNTFLVERGLYQDLCRVSLADDFFADDWEIVMRADPLNCRIHLLKEVLGQWNNMVDPKRNSISRNKQLYDRNYLPRQACYFTPKAKTAFRGRWLAPRLIQQGQFLDAIHLLVLALVQKAISPVTAIKIAVNATFPRLFKTAVVWYSRLRRRRATPAQVT
jgi:glycosyltransferase involved in cell wall biosynthesis